MTETLTQLIAQMQLWRNDNDGHYHEDDVEDVVRDWQLQLEAALAAPPEGWAWVQPVGIDVLLSRLADARDCAVPERERENLCSVAHSAISRLAEALQNLVDDSYSLVEQPSWISPATGRGVYRCLHCEATKGERTRAHAVGCPVGIAERELLIPPLAASGSGETEK